MSALYKKTILLMVLVATMSCFVLASLSAAVQILSAPVRDYLALPPESTLLADEQHELLQYLDRALILQPGNSALWQMKGDLLLHSRYRSDDLTNEILAAYTRAAQAEPAKAILWAKLATAKAMKNEFDDEFYRFYNTALAYGPNDYQVNWTLAEIGFTWWNSISVDTRVSVKESVRILYQVNANLVVLMANKHGQFHMACLWARDFPRQSLMCEHNLNRD